MALNAVQQWWMRAGGNDLNGGGYDSTVSGAGVNYSDQDTAQLSITDGATSGAGSTTLTSAAAGFTSNMVGNIIAIASGTNFQAGHYMIVTFNSTSSVVLDRTPSSGGAGSGGTGKVGGAKANLTAFTSGGTFANPTVPTAIAAGHTLWVRGAGSNDPTSADYTLSSASGYLTLPSGVTYSGNGWIRIVGYNGRPLISVDDRVVYSSDWWSFENIKVKYTGNAASSSQSWFYSASGQLLFHDCICDANGQDTIGFRALQVTNSWFKNTGSLSAGSSTVPAIMPMASTSSLIQGNYIQDWRGDGIYSTNQGVTILNNIVNGCKQRGIYFNNNSFSGGADILANTVYGCSGDGIRLEDDASGLALWMNVLNNVLVSNGGYGLNVVTGSAAASDRLRRMLDYNAFYNNTSGLRNKLNAGAHDITLTGDPFVNAAGGDFTLNNTAGAGLALRAAGFPGLFPG